MHMNFILHWNECVTRLSSKLVQSGVCLLIWFDTDLGNFYKIGILFTSSPPILKDMGRQWRNEHNASFSDQIYLCQVPLLFTRGLGNNLAGTF